MNYRDKPPNITTTGAGKNYDGYRIFHTIKTGLIEHICTDGEVKPATGEEIKRFKTDLGLAALENPKAARYLERFPLLRASGPLVDRLHDAPKEERLKETG